MIYSLQLCYNDKIEIKKLDEKIYEKNKYTIFLEIDKKCNGTSAYLNKNINYKKVIEYEKNINKIKSDAIARFDFGNTNPERGEFDLQNKFIKFIFDDHEVIQPFEYNLELPKEITVTKIDQIEHNGIIYYGLLLKTNRNETDINNVILIQKDIYENDKIENWYYQSNISYYTDLKYSFENNHLIPRRQINNISLKNEILDTLGSDKIDAIIITIKYTDGTEDWLSIGIEIINGNEYKSNK